MASLQPVSYLNVQVTEAVGSVIAARDISRSGAIIDDPAAYYVAVERASVPMGQLPLWIPVLDPIIADGVSTVNEMSLTTPGGTVYTVRLKLLKLPNAIITNPVNQPDRYTWVFDRLTLAAMKTAALAELAALAGLAVPPYISYDSTTVLETLYCYPFSEWNLGANFENLASCYKIGWDSLSIILWKGWSSTVTGPLPPPGVAPVSNRWLLNVFNDGTNFTGAPLANGEFAPPSPATTQLLGRQLFANSEIIECSTIEIHSSLPALPEYTDGIPYQTNTQNSSAPILTDMKPEFGNADPNGYQTLAIYNASGLGNARWIKLTGHSPITNFSLSIWWVDRLGIRRPLSVLYARCSVKLAFALKAIVENYKIN